MCGEAATEVDHIIPLRALGARLDERNLQPLCKRHHSKKTRRENPSAPLIY
jgi:5-methylcytosine-specific restriction endonuclease McrA